MVWPLEGKKWQKNVFRMVKVRCSLCCKMVKKRKGGGHPFGDVGHTFLVTSAKETMSRTEFSQPKLSAETLSSYWTLRNSSHKSHLLYGILQLKSSFHKVRNFRLELGLYKKVAWSKNLFKTANGRRPFVLPVSDNLTLRGQFSGSNRFLPHRIRCTK